MNIKPIKTDADYRAALKEVEVLMTAETNTPEGETLLKLLVRPRLMKQLDQLLLSDLGSRQPDLPIDHDGVDASSS